MPRRNPIGTGGPRREIDQDALVTRYTRAGWSIARCGRAFGISTEQVRKILLTRGVPLRGAPELDEAASIAGQETASGYYLVPPRAHAARLRGRTACAAGNAGVYHGDRQQSAR
ncbi:MAG: hypothetical protein ABSA53_20935 [Streptosporangiaceae bacterium]|jgi:hypothetical protein